MNLRSMLFLTVSLSLAAPGCRKGNDRLETPRDGYRAFLAAVKAGDSKRIWSRLGPETRKRLKKWKDWTNEKADLDLKARELFLVDFPKMLPSDVRVVRQDGGEALVAPKTDPSDRLDVLAGGFLVRYQSLDTMPVTKRQGEVVLGPLGLRLSATRRTTTEETFRMVRRGKRWLVELTLPESDRADAQETGRP